MKSPIRGHGIKALKEKLGLPIVHVTYDLGEVLYLGDQVMPIIRGRGKPEPLERQLEEGMEERFSHL